VPGPATAPGTRNQFVVYLLIALGFDAPGLWHDALALNIDAGARTMHWPMKVGPAYFTTTTSRVSVRFHHERTDSSLSIKYSTEKYTRGRRPRLRAHPLTWPPSRSLVTVLNGSAPCVEQTRGQRQTGRNDLPGMGERVASGW